MWNIIEAAGWPIWPLLIASVITLAIIGERFWSLRTDVVAPKNLLPEVQDWLKKAAQPAKSVYAWNVIRLWAPFSPARCATRMHHVRS